MGWARTLLLGDIGNRLDIADTERDVNALYNAIEATRDVDESQEQAIEHLKRENAQLELCVATLVKTLERKAVLSADEVKNLVEMIDR